MAETEFIEIPDFDFSAFYYPDFVRSLTIFSRQNVPEITDESDEEPYTQLIRAFALVGHLNNVLLDVVATETLLPTARLLESVRSHLRLIDVILEQAKPANTDIVVQLSALFTTPINFIPAGTQVATVETDDSPQKLFEADTDNIIQPTDAPGAVFSFDPGFVQFLSNIFHAGDTITLFGTVNFRPGIDFPIGATLTDTVNNFIIAVNASTDPLIEGLIRAYRVDDKAILTFLSDDLVSVTVSVTDNTPETTLLDQVGTGTDAELDATTDRRGDEFTPANDRTVKNVQYSLKKAGVLTGNVRCLIETDDGGANPSGTVIGTSASVNMSTIAASYGVATFSFPTTAKLTAGQKYWFILEYDAPVGVSSPAAEVTNVQFVDGANPALQEVADVSIQDASAFFDVRGAAKRWNLDAQDGSLYYLWYNVTDGAETQADGEFETTTMDFAAQTGATHDVVGAANHLLIKSALDATSYYVWFNVTDGANSQSDPAPGGTGVQVDIVSGDNDAGIAFKVADALDTLGDFNGVSLTSIATINTVAKGVTTDAADVSTGAIVAVTKQGTNELDPTRTAVEVQILTSDTIFLVAQRTTLAVDTLGDFSAVLNGGSTVRITQTNAGVVADPTDSNANITIAIPTPGTELSNDYDVNGTAKHWLLDAQVGTEYYVWYNVTDGSFTQNDPTLGGKSGVQVDILKADSKLVVASKSQAIINALPDFGAALSTDTVVITQVTNGECVDAVDVDAIVNITVVVQGTTESRILMDSSGAGDSRYFTGAVWTSVATSLVMKIVADSTNFAIRSGGFGLDKSGQSVLPAATFPLMSLVPISGSIFYIMHSTIMWDAIGMTLDTNGSGLNGVWEFYDGNVEDSIPDGVTNLGPNLEFDLTTLMGQLDRTGALVQVTFTGNGVSELANVEFNGTKNIIRTTQLLGQVAVSTDPNEYIVGSEWNEVPNLSDSAQDFTQNGKVEYDIPQDLTRNWSRKTINTFEGFPLRYRVVSVDTIVANPIIDLVDITAGKQYVLFEATQGSSQSEKPLGSSDGSASQAFELAFSPLIVESLSIEVNEGTGFSQWNLQDNFLTSTQISKDYILEVTADDVATITFGDGQNGKKPSAGVDNIRAIYRVFSGGAANDGNVGAKTITVNKSGIAFIDRVFNPRSATGFQVKEGSTAEDLARLKIAGPATLRVRNRGITPDDFEFLATEFTTATGAKLVTRALAIEETFGIKTVELVVVGSGGALLTQTQLENLSKFFNGSKPDKIKGVGLTNHEVTAVNYSPRTININAEVTGGNKAQIENAIKALLNPEAKFEDGVTFRWDFDDNVPLAIIIAAIIAVDPQNIKNVNLTSPVTDIDLAAKELPLAGTLNIIVL